MPLSTELTNCDVSGASASIYYNTADTGVAYDCSAAVWVRHKGILGDITVNETEAEAELTRRDPGQIYKEFTSSKIALDISGTHAYDINYEGNDYLLKARNGNQPVDLMFLSGLISVVNSAGYRGKFRNFDRGATFPLEGAVAQNFKLMPAACQLVACKVRAVKVAVANAVIDYAPGIITAFIGSALVGSSMIS